jgi:hypothetical protein
MKVYRYLLIFISLSILSSCGENQEQPPVVVNQTPVPPSDTVKVEESPQTKEERIADIKLWYSEIQKIGMQNCEIKKRVKYDSFDSESQKIPFDQIVKICKLNDSYELIRGEFYGYEWLCEVTIYKKNGKIFFVFVDGASEAWSYEKRYYCDKDENVIKHLENEADGGMEIKGGGQEMKLNPNKLKIQDNIANYLNDIDYVLNGK